MSTHTASVFTGLKDDLKLTEIQQVSTPTPGPNDILLKVKSNAFNPTDWKHVVVGWGKKGCIPGSDASGVVAAVGDKVEGFKVGDTISSFTHGGYTPHPTGGSFQEYVLVDPFLSIKYDTPLVEDASNLVASPAVIKTFEGASTITLALITVGLSFYNKLGLRFEKSQQAGKSIVIWGGASATGQIAIQVAKKVFGLTVYAVASKKNHDLLINEYGADQCFDYHDADVVEQIKAVGGDDLVYGYDTISYPETFNSTYDCLSSTKTAFLENLLMLSEKVITKPRKNITISSSLAYLARGEDNDLNGMKVPSSPEIVADHLAYWSQIVKFINDGTLKHIPYKVLDGGLASVDLGLSLLRNNKVSCEKLVFRMSDTK